MSHLEEGERRPRSTLISSYDTTSNPTSSKGRILEWLNQIKTLIENGRITEFLFVGRDAENKHFLTEVSLPTPPQSEIFGFVGVLEALKLELTERAQLAPALMSDGSVLNPHEKETDQ